MVRIRSFAALILLAAAWLAPAIASAQAPAEETEQVESLQSPAPTPTPPTGEPPPGYVPAPGYGAPPPGYVPAPGYGAPPPGYVPAPGYGAPPPGYVPAPGYGAPPPGYVPAPGYGAPPPGYVPAPGYGAPPPGYVPAPGYPTPPVPPANPLAPPQLVPTQPPDPAIGVGGSTSYPVRNARLRLASVQALNVGILTAEACVLLRRDTEANRCAPFPVLLGSATALGVGLGVRHSIDSDHVSAINGGTFLGAAHGLMILGMARLYDPTADRSHRAAALSTMAVSQGAGTILGHLIYRAHPARPGVVDAANVFGTWSGLSAMMLVMGYADPTEDTTYARLHFGTMMAATDVGIAIGVAIGRATPFTPYRSLLVHGYVLTTQMLGLVVAAPVMVEVTEEKFREDDFWRVMGYSSLVGMLIAVGATSDAGSRGGNHRPLFAFDLEPVRGGALGSVRGTF